MFGSKKLSEMNQEKSRTRTRHQNEFSNRRNGGIQVGSDARAPEIDIKDILYRLYLGFSKLFVALRYQLFKRVDLKPLPSVQRLPVFKLAVLGLLAFIAFKDDFSLNLGNANIAVEDSERKSTQASSLDLGMATPVSMPAENPMNFFEDRTGDSDKDRRYKAYIRRFAETARTESERFGIPASIKMAQGLLESSAGDSRLATKNNNHFGMKCFSKKCSKGHCSNFNDDHHKDFFRSYQSAWESWRAHSKLLQKKHYKGLKQHGNDYRAWAHGLKAAGYATDPNYAPKLIKLIETYQLHRLDR